MRERHSLPVRPTARRLTVAVDVVTLSPRDDALAVLLVPAFTGARERWSLPWDGPRGVGRDLGLGVGAVARAPAARWTTAVQPVVGHAGEITG